jgi:hypothetical protein
MLEFSTGYKYDPFFSKVQGKPGLLRQSITNMLNTVIEEDFKVFVDDIISRNNKSILVLKSLLTSINPVLNQHKKNLAYEL